MLTTGRRRRRGPSGVGRRRSRVAGVRARHTAGWQWPRVSARAGKAAPRRAGAAGEGATSSVRSVAPRLASTSARAAAPMLARRTESPIRVMSVSSSSCSECTCTAAPRCQEHLGDLGEVGHRRTEHHRPPVHRRLEDVVAAGRHQAAADKGHRRQLIDLRQLADGVEHDDVGARIGVDGQLGPPRGGKALPARDVHHLGEPVGVPRRQDQQRLRLRGLDTAERLQHGPFFPAHRAAGDHDRPARRQAEETQDPLARPAVRRRRRHVDGVELQAAGDGDSRRVGAHQPDAPRALVALHAERVHVRQHVPHQRRAAGDTGETTAPRRAR